MENWKTEKLNYFGKCQWENWKTEFSQECSTPDISPNISVFQFFSFPIDISQIIQFFSFSIGIFQSRSGCLSLVIAVPNSSHICWLHV